MNKRQIIKETLAELKRKGLLKEDLTSFHKNNNVEAFQELANKIAKSCVSQLNDEANKIESEIHNKPNFALGLLIERLEKYLKN